MKMEKAMMLLSAERENYKVKRELLTHSELTTIAKYMQKKDHIYHGRIQCVHMHGNYLFFGNSIGIIRVFDINR